MEHHPLRATDTAIVFADLQEGIVNVGATADPERLRTCVAALAEVATIFSLPVAIACVPTTSGAIAPTLPEIATRFPASPRFVRTSANPMDDPGLRAALEAFGRHTVIIAGVATEVAVALAAFSARTEGYEVVVAVDACSGLDARSESATFAQLTALGITLSSVPTIAAELAGDFTSEHGRAAMAALQSMLGTHTRSHSRHDHDHDHDHDHADSAAR